VVAANSAPAREIAPIVDRLKSMAHLPPGLFAADLRAKCSHHSLEENYSRPARWHNYRLVKPP